MMTARTAEQPERSMLPLFNEKSGGQSMDNDGIVELNLRELGQLFDTLDPSPFREKDLDRGAEEYIVDSVKELSTSHPCTLLIHINQAINPDDESVVRDAIRVHFARKSRISRRNLRQLFRRGRISLGIGFAFLSVLFIAAQTISRAMGERGVAMLLREGLIIIGWVAMWRPLEIFLYDWWPILGERRLYDRLSQMNVRIVSKSSGPSIHSGTSNSSADIATALAGWESEGGRVNRLGRQ